MRGRNYRTIESIRNEREEGNLERQERIQDIERNLSEREVTERMERDRLDREKVYSLGVAGFALAYAVSYLLW